MSPFPAALWLVNIDDDQNEKNNAQSIAQIQRVATKLFWANLEDTKCWKVYLAFPAILTAKTTSKYVDLRIYNFDVKFSSELTFKIFLKCIRIGRINMYWKS